MGANPAAPWSADPHHACVVLFDAIHRSVAKEIPELDPMLTMRACVAFAFAERDGVDLDISSFAVSVGVSRSRASRFLRDWERCGYCTLDSVGSRTLVLWSPKFREACSRVFKTITHVIVDDV